MRTVVMLAWLLAGARPVCAQDDTVTVADVVEGAREWVDGNLSTNGWMLLPGLNRQTTHQFIHDMQQRFQGEYVIEFVPFQRAGENLVPWLESFPATEPYGAWLKARWDDLQTAAEIPVTIPPPEVETNPAVAPRFNLLRAWAQAMWLEKAAADFLPPAVTNYVVRLKGVFLAQKVPPELFWLSEVESGFDVNARSPTGAVGLFQLKPDTARRFGLSLAPSDQRLDPESNARAAAQYLKYLHDRFHDWRLALAAYNAGENTVQRLLDRYHTQNYDVIARRLPSETQLYVPRVEAILERREGVKLSELQTPPDWIVRQFQGHE